MIQPTATPRRLHCQRELSTPPLWTLDDKRTSSYALSGAMCTRTGGHRHADAP
ncbi:hypothetical protein ACWGK1_11050 [Streptomyces wedmorensis]